MKIRKATKSKKDQHLTKYIEIPIFVFNKNFATNGVWQLHTDRQTDTHTHTYIQTVVVDLLITAV